jgi:hypothetical protein
MSYIKIKCNLCHKDHQINNNQFNFEQVDSFEREMGAEIHYEGNLEFQCGCGQTIEVNHQLWEYPEGVENLKETKVSGCCTVIENTLSFPISKPT